MEGALRDISRPVRDGVGPQELASSDVRAALSADDAERVPGCVLLACLVCLSLSVCFRLYLCIVFVHVSLCLSVILFCVLGLVMSFLVLARIIY